MVQAPSPASFGDSQARGTHKTLGWREPGLRSKERMQGPWKRVLRIAPYRASVALNKAPRDEGAGSLDPADVCEAALRPSFPGVPGHTGALGLAGHTAGGPRKEGLEKRQDREK